MEECTSGVVIPCVVVVIVVVAITTITITAITSALGTITLTSRPLTISKRGEEISPGELGTSILAGQRFTPQHHCVTSTECPGNEVNKAIPSPAQIYTAHNITYTEWWS